MNPPAVCPSRHILNVRVDATTYADATARVVSWAEEARSCYVCLATVNNIMEAHGSRDYQSVMREADLVTSDGMPLVWLLRGLGVAGASRVYGPDLTLTVLAAAAERGIAVGFYGGSERVLSTLIETVTRRFPDVKIAYAFAPPFRTLTTTEDEEVTRAIEQSGARILFVGLGGAKQDYWMHAHHGRVRSVMLGVGAAFDFIARHQASSAPLDATERTRMGLPPGYRAAAVMAALPFPEPTLRHLGPRTIGAHAIP